MAELKNEGIPYRVYDEHPEIVPVRLGRAPGAVAHRRLPRSGLHRGDRALVRRDHAGAGAAAAAAGRQHHRGPARQRGRHAGLGHQQPRPDRRSRRRPRPLGGRRAPLARPLPGSPGRRPAGPTRCARRRKRSPAAPGRPRRVHARPLRGVRHHAPRPRRGARRARRAVPGQHPRDGERQRRALPDRHQPARAHLCRRAGDGVGLRPLPRRRDLGHPHRPLRDERLHGRRARRRPAAHLAGVRGRHRRLQRWHREPARPVDGRPQDPPLRRAGQPADQLLPPRRRHQPAAGGGRGRRQRPAQLHRRAARHGRPDRPGGPARLHLRRHRPHRPRDDRPAGLAVADGRGARRRRSSAWCSTRTRPSTTTPAPT